MSPRRTVMRTAGLRENRSGHPAPPRPGRSRWQAIVALLAGASVLLVLAPAADARHYRPIVSVSDPLGSATISACRAKVRGTSYFQLYFRGKSSVAAGATPISINARVKAFKSRRLKTSDTWDFYLGTGQPPVYNGGPGGPYNRSARIRFTLWTTHPPATALVPTVRDVRFSKLRRC